MVSLKKTRADAFLPSLEGMGFRPSLFEESFSGADLSGEFTVGWIAYGFRARELPVAGSFPGRSRSEDVGPTVLSANSSRPDLTTHSISSSGITHFQEQLVVTGDDAW